MVDMNSFKNANERVEVSFDAGDSDADKLSAATVRHPFVVYVG